jgi:hypothetical protein
MSIEEDKKTLTEAFVAFLEKHSGGSNKEVQQAPEAPVVASTTIKKAVEEEQRKALFIVLQPQEDDTPDLHGDAYTAQEVEKAADNFNTYCGQANVQHTADTEHAQILESYVAPVDFTLDNGRVVMKGAWVQTWKFLETEQGEYLWSGVKDGTFTGLSIGCTASTGEI